MTDEAKSEMHIRLLTTSRLFIPLYGQYAVYTMMVNMIGWRALYKVGYLQHQELHVQFHVWTLNFETRVYIDPCSQTEQGSNSQCSESSESQEVETSYSGQKIVVQEPENQFGSINKIHLTINVS